MVKTSPYPQSTNLVGCRKANLRGFKGKLSSPTQGNFKRSNFKSVIVYTDDNWSRWKTVQNGLFTRAIYLWLGI
jgi:hypothetical protein